MNRRSLLVKTLIVLLLVGCSAGSKIRHLSSDVCLVVPETTTRQEVVAFLGKPDGIRINAEKEEVWSYQTVRKSLLRKMPFFGKSMGSEEYEVVTVTFSGDQVRTCYYRNLSEPEFNTFSSETEIQVKE